MAQINEIAPDLPATVSEPVRNLVFACIAKNPADRPASAAHLARAATALRRGDVAAAAAAVPAVLAGITATAATQLMPSAGDDQATALFPTTTPTTRAEAQAADADSKKKKKPSPWTWPLIALIALLALVLVGTLIALFNQPSTPEPTKTTASSPATTPSPAPSSAAPTPTPTPTPTPERVEVTRSEFIGLSSADARAKLQELQLVADVQTGNAATTPDDVDKVYEVNPTGAVKIGETITVTVYGPVVTPTTPSSAPTREGSDPVAPGQAVTISWPAASCPSGQTLTGYEVSADGGAAVQQPNPTSATATSATITAGNSNFTVKYRYFCGQIESGYSPALSVTVQAAQQ